MSKPKKPTKQQIERAQIKAVHEVLYESKRLRTLTDNLKSISVLMNLDPTLVLQPNDLRVKAGAGPIWYFEDSGQPNPDVTQSAGLADDVSSTLKQMAHDLGGVSIPHADRTYLQTALTEQADAWTLRARWWRAPTPAADIKGTAARIAGHVANAAAAAAKVQKYYRSEMIS